VVELARVAKADQEPRRRRSGRLRWKSSIDKRTVANVKRRRRRRRRQPHGEEEEPAAAAQHHHSISLLLRLLLLLLLLLLLPCVFCAEKWRRGHRKNNRTFEKGIQGITENGILVM
jgi:hypothetical protein